MKKILFIFILLIYTGLNAQSYDIIDKNGKADRKLQSLTLKQVDSFIKRNRAVDFHIRMWKMEGDRLRVYECPKDQKVIKPNMILI
tara:strand:+ start:54 stop:311 length:258 start_codon:yes stop_codon:yes gene_type:complete